MENSVPRIVSCFSIVFVLSFLVACSWDEFSYEMTRPCAMFGPGDPRLQPCLEQYGDRALPYKERMARIKQGQGQEQPIQKTSMQQNGRQAAEPRYASEEQQKAFRELAAQLKQILEQADAGQGDVNIAINGCVLRRIRHTEQVSTIADEIPLGDLDYERILPRKVNYETPGELRVKTRGGKRSIRAGIIYHSDRPLTDDLSLPKGWKSSDLFDETHIVLDSREAATDAAEILGELARFCAQ